MLIALERGSRRQKTAAFPCREVASPSRALRESDRIRQRRQGGNQRRRVAGSSRKTAGRLLGPPVRKEREHQDPVDDVRSVSRMQWRSGRAAFRKRENQGERAGDSAVLPAARSDGNPDHNM